MRFRGGVALADVEITTTSKYLDSGTVGTEYSFKIGVDGAGYDNYGSYHYEGTATITSGALPDGLSIENHKGTWWDWSDYTNGSLIKGTPVKSGTFTFTLRIEYNGSADEREFKITIVANPNIEQPSIGSTLPNGIIGVPYDHELLGSKGDSNTYKWDHDGNLPDGLDFDVGSNSSRYRLHGTPEKLGTYTFKVTLADKYEPENGKNEKSFTVTIGDGSTTNTNEATTGTDEGEATNEDGETSDTDTGESKGETDITVDVDKKTSTTSPLNITGTLIDGLVGIPYGDSTSGTSKDIYVMATGGKPPYDWRSEGNFPPESEIKGYISGASSEYVVLKGTPTKSATYDFTIFVKDADNTEKSKSFSITISEQTEENIAQYNNTVNNYKENKAIDLNVGGDSQTIVNVYKNGPSVNVEGDNTDVKTDTNKSLSLGTGGGCNAGFGLLGLMFFGVALSLKRSK